MQPFDFLQHLPVILPEIGLTILAVIVLAMDVGFLGLGPLPESRRHYIPYVAAIIMTALVITPFLGPQDGMLYWGGMVRHDVLAQVFKVIVLLGGAITCLIASGTRDFSRKSEFYLVIIVATLGASLMSGAADLIMVFVALETTTIPLYILAAFRRDDQRSSESGMKYFLFGSFASAVMLYGFSLLYGFTGQTNLYALAQYLGTEAFAVNPIPVLIAIVLILVGFGFKISAAPFHFWTPDVYEGAPTPVTAFVSVVSKAASFALLVRFFSAAFPPDLTLGSIQIQDFWLAVVTAVAVISMTLGNLAALWQKNIKRLLAYSSIAQAGYTLIGVAALQSLQTSQSGDGGESAIAAIAFYMLMYTFTNLLAFAVIVIFSEATGSETIADFAGVSRRNPWIALAMTIAFLSLAGIPPAAGFFGKFFLFNAAVDANLVWLAIVGVLNSIVALYYYLVVIKTMYVDRSADDDQPIRITPVYAWVLGLTSVAVLLLGIIPTAIYDWARGGAQALSLIQF